MGQEYKAAMIVIGNEILSGRTQDLNVSYVAKKLVDRGVTLAEVRVVSDIEGEIIAAIHDLKERVDYIFTSGGIGPTHDDITAASVARAFDVALEKNAEARAILLNHYGEEGLTDERLEMASMPVGVSSLIPNPVSGAPGFVIGNVHVMAGVPRICHAMMDHVAAGLKGGAVIKSRTVECMVGESAIANNLSALQDKWPDIDIGSYPYFEDGIPGVNIVLRSSDEAVLDDAEADVVAMVGKLKA